MPYEVTATRRRPKTFDELAGQEFVTATLKNSLEKGQIAHAYLFSGPRGCGKTSAARILARALRCEKGTPSQPCGVCPQCVEVLRGTSMDVLEIDGASNTGVNDVRQIKEEVLFPPTTGRYKVYIIDEVHMLSNSAFNALLKTIEEPPPNVVFIFATTELQKVPATIRSRCQQFNFRLIAVETIIALLREACKEIGAQAEDDALLWIAREATGSCRDAYTIFDQVASFSGGHIRMELIREKLGLVGLDELNNFAESCAAGDFSLSLSLLDAVLSSGVAVETFITGLAGYYHSLLLLKAGVTRDSVLGYAPARFSRLVLEKYDTIRLERAGELLYELYRDIRYSVSPRFELETLVSKLCWLEKWISPAELGDAVAKTQTMLNSPVALATPTQEKQAPSLTEEFKRQMANRGNPRENSAPQAVAPQDPTGVPQAGAPQAVRNVMSVFNGTIVEEGR
jgi:DNA polymerase-3 subunit gamma/tau